MGHMPVKRLPSEEPSSSVKYLRQFTLVDAIKEAGPMEKAPRNGFYDLSRLSNKERTSLIADFGTPVHRQDAFSSLPPTAIELKDANFQIMDKISTSHGTLFPVVRTDDLYVRDVYKDLYDIILSTFHRNRPNAGMYGENRVVATGTAGIGISAFLVYFAIRLLAESDEDNGPMIIFHSNRRNECYVFGGRSTVRSGDIRDFRPFLDLRDTWYLVDSTSNPTLVAAKTVIAVSTETLFSAEAGFKDVEKQVPWRYYMPPWKFEELMHCRANVATFELVPSKLVRDLYSKIGGVPRYVLQWPMKELKLRPGDLDRAEAATCERLNQQFKVIDWAKLKRCFPKVKESLHVGSSLIHRWPTSDHRSYQLEWASLYVAEEFARMLSLRDSSLIL